MAQVDVLLYTRQGENEVLTSATRDKLNKRGVVFQEVDLTGKKLDDEWPALPVISSIYAFVGGFQNEKVIEKWVSFLATRP